MFLLAGVRLRETVENLLHTELTCADPDDRMQSLLRYVTRISCPRPPVMTVMMLSEANWELRRHVT